MAPPIRVGTLTMKASITVVLILHLLSQQLGVKPLPILVDYLMVRFAMLPLQ